MKTFVQLTIIILCFGSCNLEILEPENDMEWDIAVINGNQSEFLKTHLNSNMQNSNGRLSKIQESDFELDSVLLYSSDSIQKFVLSIKDRSSVMNFQNYVLEYQQGKVKSYLV